jgi:hypothetical protein
MLELGAFMLKLEAHANFKSKYETPNNFNMVFSGFQELSG